MSDNSITLDKVSYFRPLPKESRKNILLLCDDIRMHSGVATMAKEFVIGTAHHFNWYNLGAAIKHPEEGKVFDLSESVNQAIGIEDADVKIQPNSGYGDPNKLRALLKKYDFDAIFIFTDPRYWTWLFEMEREIRNQIPIFYLNIWDDLPAPMYNKQYYNSVDVLLAISKQTKNINQMVLGDQAKNKIIEYVPHGINEDRFFPIHQEHELFTQLIDLKSGMFNGKDIEFVVFFNSRNIHRKRPGDTILAYKEFCDRIGKEKAKKCALVMHTHAVDNNGTDLRAVKNALTDPEYVNIYFSQNKIDTNQMNMLYNIADVTVLMSSNEGWGLSLTESLMSGTMIIANTTGGMQDQMRFEDENGDWVDFSSEYPSNHRGRYRKHGKWSRPVYPSNISLAGSPTTPYIFDDRCSYEDVAEALVEVYNLPKQERDNNGMEGRKWVTSEESQMSANSMSNNIITVLDKAFDSFIPRKRFDLIKVENVESTFINQKTSNY